jgi:cytochrome c-type biogenesis protein CcmH
LPPLALAGGGVALWMHNRRRTKSATAEDQSLRELTAEEEARLEQLIASEPSPERTV